MTKFKTVARIKITCSICVYNEEARIRPVIENASCWADEVLVINKSSTDRTKEICLEYGDKVRVVDIPFSLKGHEDAVALSQLPSNNWVYYGTASELPTFKLIKRIKKVLDETDGKLDIVYVPRKIYSFGIYSPKSPWSIFHYPFVINRSRTIVSSNIHANFSPMSQDNTYTIPYEEDCCIYHFTHASAKTYLSDMMQYFEAEVKGVTNPASKYSECFNNIDRFKKRYRAFDDDLFGLYCAWQMYWLGTALYVWEKNRGVDVSGVYERLKSEIAEKEWGFSGSNTMGKRQTNKPITMRMAYNTDDITSEDMLLLELGKRKICNNISVLYVVGAHRFQESELIFQIFPALQKVYLFEPVQECYQYLVGKFKDDLRVEVYPYAIADGEFTAEFHISSNDAASSSLLPFGKHRDLFPEVSTVGTIQVSCKTLDSVLADHGLLAPDMLFIDAQGAEYRILASMSDVFKSGLAIIYTEASKEELYVGARPLDDIIELLEPEIVFTGFAPLNRNTLTHGNALFIKDSSLDAFNAENDTYVVAVFENNNKQDGWLLGIWHRVCSILARLK